MPRTAPSPQPFRLRVFVENSPEACSTRKPLKLTPFSMRRFDARTAVGHGVEIDIGEIDAFVARRRCARGRDSRAGSSGRGRWRGFSLPFSTEGTEEMVISETAVSARMGFRRLAEIRLSIAGDVERRDCRKYPCHPVGQVGVEGLACSPAGFPAEIRWRCGPMGLARFTVSSNMMYGSRTRTGSRRASGRTRAR